MAKKDKAETVVADGEQLDLIDVNPENVKKIIPVARLYKAAQTKRLAALADEKKHKAKVLELVAEANLQPLEGGKIRFSADGYMITVTPRDELVQVKEELEP